MAIVKHVQTTKNNLNAIPITDGQLIYATDTREQFLDFNNKRIRIDNNIDVSDKMDTNNPNGTGSFSLNRKIDTVVGCNSFAVGEASEASGAYSFAEGYKNHATNIGTHAEGYKNYADGEYSHAEGIMTQALGNKGSHSEGEETVAQGMASHSEGSTTIAAGDYSHSEGLYVSANGNCQHVQGKYNVVDNANIFSHIVGGGVDAFSLKNIHSLDWSGNGYFAKNIYVNSTCDDVENKGIKLRPSVISDVEPMNLVDGDEWLKYY